MAESSKNESGRKWSVIGDDIDKTHLGAYQIWTVAIEGGINFAEGYEMQMLSVITDPIARDLHVGERAKSALMSVVFVGFMVGNIVSGCIGDTFGRRLPILWSYFGMFVFSIASALASNFTVVLLLRACLGFSQALGQPAFCAHLAEVVQSSWRPALFCAYGAWFGVGTVFAASVAWLDDPTYQHLHWQYLLGSSAIPCLILGMLTYAYGDESPYFLSAQNDEAGAEVVLNRMGSSAKRSPTVNRLLTPKSAFLEIFVTHFRATIIMTVAVIAANFAYFGMCYALPRMGPSLRLKTTTIGSLIAWGSTVGLVGNLFLLFVGDRLPRSWFMSMTFFGSSLGIVQMMYGITNGAESSIAVGFVVMTIFNNAAYCIVDLLGAELYPTEIRSTAVGTFMTIGRVACIVAPPAFEFTDVYAHAFNASSPTAKARVFCEIIVAISLFAAVVVLFLKTDTRGKQLDTVYSDEPSETTALVA